MRLVLYWRAAVLAVLMVPHVLFRNAVAAPAAAPVETASGGVPVGSAPTVAPMGAAPAWALNQPIYEINLQTFSQPGTYQELKKHLPRLKQLGVGILWLMPITPRGTERAFGSPYCVKDYYGFHAPYGSAQDFKDLVAETHRQGLHLILDWVPNHTSWDNALTRDHKDYYKRDAAGNIQQAYSWSDVAQLDYSNPALRAYMIGALKHWVSEYDVDGFRFDVAWGVPNDFWAEARAALDKVKPTFFLAEANNPLDQASFHSNYDWELMGITEEPALVKLSRGSMTLAALDEMILKDRRLYTAPFQRMRFTSNHDEWNNFGTPAQRLGTARKALAVLAATLPGKPLLWNGQEIDWNPGNRQASIAWTEGHEYTDFYGRLLRLHQKSPALHAGGFQRLRTSEDASVYAFVRVQDRHRVVVLLNFSGQGRTFTLAADGIAANAGQYADLYTGGALTLPAAAPFDLPAWGYRVLVTEDARTGTGLRRTRPATPGNMTVTLSPGSLPGGGRFGSTPLFSRGSGSEVCNAAGVPVGRIPAAPLPDRSKLRTP